MKSPRPSSALLLFSPRALALALIAGVLFMVTPLATASLTVYVQDALH